MILEPKIKVYCLRGNAGHAESEPSQSRQEHGVGHCPAISEIRTFQCGERQLLVRRLEGLVFVLFL